MRLQAPLKSDWKDGEEPTIELLSIGFETVKGRQLPNIVMRHTPRGERELLRRERNEKELHRRYLLDVKKHPERYFPDASFYL